VRGLGERCALGVVMGPASVVSIYSDDAGSGGATS
jgi:hypothetical protein